MTSNKSTAFFGSAANLSRLRGLRSLPFLDIARTMKVALLRNLR